MHNLSPEIKINYFAISALVAYLILPILNRGLPSAVRVVLVCALVVMYLLTLYMIDRPGTIETIAVMAITVAFVVLCYFGSTQTVSLPQYVFTSYLFWIPFLFIYNRQYTRDAVFCSFLAKLVIILCSVTAITTIIGLTADPMAARNLATGLTEENSLQSYSIRNIGGYGFIYSLVLLIPLLIGAWRNDSIKKIYIVLALILALACIFRSQYTTALGLTIVALLTVFLGKRFSPLKLCVLVVCEIVALIALINLLPAFVGLISNLGPEASFMAYRLSDSLSTISTDGIFGLDRVQRAEMSWSIFVENPLSGNLFSTMPSELGAHSALLDLLASMGLLVIPFILFFIIAIIGRLLNRLVSLEIKPYAVASILIFFVLGSINTVLSSFTIPVVLFLVPLGLSHLNEDTALNNRRSAK